MFVDRDPPGPSLVSHLHVRLQDEYTHLTPTTASVSPTLPLTREQQQRRIRELEDENQQLIKQLQFAQETIRRLRVKYGEEHPSSSSSSASSPTVPLCSSCTSFASERAALHASKRRMEVRLMKFEPFSPVSPLHAGNRDEGKNETNEATTTTTAGSTSEDTNVTTTAVAVASSVHDVRTSPRTSVLRGLTDAPQLHLSSPRSSVGGASSSSTSTTMSLIDKKKLLLDKLASLESMKQQIGKRIETYIGPEMTYFEVTIEAGVAGVDNQQQHRNIAAGLATHRDRPASAMTHNEHARTMHAPSIDVGKSAMFIGLSVGYPCSPTGPTTVRDLPGHHHGSWGYCSLNGRVYEGARSTSMDTAINGGFGGEFDYGPSYTRGDTIGVGWNISSKSIFFTKNGSHMGLAAMGVELTTYYAAIGIVSTYGGEQFTINFGERPFLWRGLPLADQSLKLDKQLFLYNEPPCKGMSLDASRTASAAFQIHAYRPPGNGGMEVSDTPSSSSSNRFSFDTADVLESNAGLDHSTVVSPSSSNSYDHLPRFETACFVLPPDSQQQQASPTHYHSHLLHHGHAPITLPPGGVRRTDTMGVIYSRESLLPVIDVTIHLSGLLPFLHTDHPTLVSLRLHVYIKDSAGSNFRASSSSPSIHILPGPGPPPNFEPPFEGAFTHHTKIIYQRQPKREIMLVVNGSDHSGNVRMIGVADDIIDMTALVEGDVNYANTLSTPTPTSTSSLSSFVTSFNKDGHPLPDVSARFTIDRINGGRPSLRHAATAAALKRSHQLPMTGESRAIPTTPTMPYRSSSPSAASTPTHSPTQSVYATHANDSTLQPWLSPSSPSPSASLSPPSTPSRVIRGHPIDRLSNDFDSTGHLRPSTTPVSTSSLTPLTHTRVMSQSSTLDVHERELAPLTRRLNVIHHDCKRMNRLLQQLREEVAAYLENQPSNLLQSFMEKMNVQALGSAASSPLASLRSSSASAGAGVADLSTIRSSLASSSSSSSLGLSFLGVGSSSDAELDAFVAIGHSSGGGGGAYSSLFHLHILLQTFEPSEWKLHFQKFIDLLPLLEKQSSRMMLPYVQRMKKREEEIDKACLFQ